MHAYASGYADGQAAQKRGDAAFATAKSAAVAEIDRINMPIHAMIADGTDVPSEMWERQAEAITYSHGVNDGGYDARQARGTQPTFPTVAQQSPSAHATRSLSASMRSALQREPGRHTRPPC